MFRPGEPHGVAGARSSEAWQVRGDWAAVDRRGRDCRPIGEEQRRA